MPVYLAPQYDCERRRVTQSREVLLRDSPCDSPVLVNREYITGVYGHVWCFNDLSFMPTTDSYGIRAGGKITQQALDHWFNRHDLFHEVWINLPQNVTRTNDYLIPGTRIRFMLRPCSRSKCKWCLLPKPYRVIEVITSWSITKLTIPVARDVIRHWFGFPLTRLYAGYSTLEDVYYSILDAKYGAKVRKYCASVCSAGTNQSSLVMRASVM